MKKLLLYIDNMLYGGANRVMANLANYFSGLGYDIVLVNDRAYSKELSGYAVNEAVKRYYLDEGRKNLLKKTVHRITQLRSILKTEKPDIALSFMAGPNIRMLTASMGLSVKKVVSVRNDPEKEYGTGLWKPFMNLLFRQADGVVFQTNDAANYFSKGIRKKSKVIFNPVNEKFYERKWRPGGKNIVVVGRLQPQKNPMNVLQAFAQIAGAIPDVSLDYIGEGELKAELVAYAEQSGLTERVRFLGKREDIGSILEGAVMYVLCSDFEGMPNALMEAMAVGVPAISTDCPCGGPRSLIQNNMQGVLVPCRRSDILAEEMKKLLHDQKCQLLMSDEERKRAIEFKPAKILAEWSDYLFDD